MAQDLLIQVKLGKYQQQPYFKLSERFKSENFTYDEINRIIMFCELTMTRDVLWEIWHFK